MITNHIGQDADACMEEQRIAAVPSPPGCPVDCAAASLMEGREAEAVAPLSMYQLVKAAAAAASMAEGRVAEVVVPSCVRLELAASPSWTDGTWAKIAMAPYLERVGEQPWAGLGLAVAGASRPSSSPWAQLEGASV